MRKFSSSPTHPLASAKGRFFFYASLIACGIFGLALQNPDAPEPVEKVAVEKPAEEKSAPFAGKIVVIPIGTDQFENEQKFRDLRNVLTEIENSEANAVIFEIDNASVSEWKLIERLLNEIEKVTVPKIAFVNTQGTQAGAFVALASEKIFMAPSGIIGGAGLQTTVASDEDETSAAEANLAQSLSIRKARARSLASQNGHRVDVAEAFIDADVEVKIGDETISEKGQILTLTADEAARVIEGKPLFAASVVKTIDQLVEQAKLSGEIEKVDASEFVSKRNRDRLSQKTADRTREKREEESGTVFRKRDKINYEGKIVVLKIGDDTLATGKASFEFIDRTIQRAELDGAVAVIFDMDTPGGYAWYTQDLVLNSLQNLSIPTYTFVNSQAFSAGAIIAVGTDTIYMNSAGTIGSALVVGGGGQDLDESMNDKITKGMVELITNVAVLKGHNPDVAKAFVTNDTVVEIGGTTVHDGNGVLSLNAIRATEVIDGKPVLAKGIAVDLPDLIKQEGLEGEIVEAEALGLEAIAHTLQKFSAILLIIGIAGAYMEMNSPGFGIPGFISVGAFSLLFFGNHMAGNLAGYELIVMFVLGVILVGVEIFLFPGAVIPALVGGLLIIVSLVMALTDSVDFEWKSRGLPGAGTWVDVFGGATLAVSFGIIGAAVLVGIAMRYLPSTPMGRWLVLEKAVAGGASIEARGANATEKSEDTSYVGLSGEATTDLRPAGKGKFGKKFLDITADGEFLEKGTPLKIVKHEGSRIVVESA